MRTWRPIFMIFKQQREFTNLCLALYSVATIVKVAMKIRFVTSKLFNCQYKLST